MFWTCPAAAPRTPKRPQRTPNRSQTDPKQIQNIFKTGSRDQKMLNWNVMEFSGPRSGPGNSRNERFSGFLVPGTCFESVLDLFGICLGPVWGPLGPFWGFSGPRPDRSKTSLSSNFPISHRLPSVQGQEFLNPRTRAQFPPMTPRKKSNLVVQIGVP